MFLAVCVYIQCFFIDHIHYNINAFIMIVIMQFIVNLSCLHCFINMHILAKSFLVYCWTTFSTDTRYACISVLHLAFFALPQNVIYCKKEY